MTAFHDCSDTGHMFMTVMQNKINNASTRLSLGAASPKV